MLQTTLEGRYVLDVKIEQSISIIQDVLKRSKNIPLFVMFSGGKDSLLLLDLVQRTTDNFLCCYMSTGIEFPEVLESNIKYCENLGLELCVSFPKDHKGNFFDRIKKFKRFPNIKATWCSRDLKIRPLNKILRKRFGKYSKFYKLNGVRMYESTRRTAMHKNTPKKVFMIPDYDVQHAFMVFPILMWTTEERNQYLKLRELRPPTRALYKKYSISGCYWCPFYQPSIYEQILKDFPNLYDEFIEWELKLDMPSVQGHV